MCGIAGIINYHQQPVREPQLQHMMDCMRHRGPNDEGTFIDQSLGFGFVRLSIIDLSAAGHQPMRSEDGRYTLIFNGEIYNYIELRAELKQLGYRFRTQTDTEVLLTAYRAWGKDMLDRINGMFAFVVYDQQQHQVFAARDRFGIKPFYYYFDNERFIFASEIKPILRVLGKKPTPDQNSLFDFLLFNRTDQTERTFFKEIKKLNHGHCFTLSTKAGTQPGNHFYIHRWYDIRQRIQTPFTDSQGFAEQFRASVKLRLRSDVPVGVCLSGGLDSSSIVSVLLKDFAKHDLNTFSAVYGQGKFGDESQFIDLYRSQLKNMYFTTPDEHSLMSDIPAFVTAHEEPVPSTSPYAQYKVMQLAREHVTVTLDGQGADEALAGYHYIFGFQYKQLLRQGKIGRLLSEMVWYYRNHRSTYGLKSFLFFLLPKALRTRVRAAEKGYVDSDFYQAYASQDTIAGKLYGSVTLQEALINHFEYKLEHLLKWEDRNSMKFSIEARVPFLDHRLVEQTLSLPDNLIINQGMTKHILREAMKGYLPEAIRLRKDKTGFGTPQDEWFRSPIFKPYILDLIHSPSFAQRGLVDVKKVQQLYQRHLKKQGNYAKEIWKWIHLENWFREFIDAKQFVEEEKHRKILV